MTRACQLGGPGFSRFFATVGTPNVSVPRVRGRVTAVAWQALLISAEAADCTQAALDWAHCCTFGVKTLLAARLHPHRSTSVKKLQLRAQQG